MALFPMNSILHRNKTKPKHKEHTKLSIMKGSFLWWIKKQAIENYILITPEVFTEPLIYTRQLSVWQDEGW